MLPASNHSYHQVKTMKPHFSLGESKHVVKAQFVATQREAQTRPFTRPGEVLGVTPKSIASPIDCREFAGLLLSVVFATNKHGGQS
jgi:hypothetical protein